MGVGVSKLATLIISAAGVIVALLVLTAVAFVLSLNDDRKEVHGSTNEF